MGKNGLFKDLTGQRFHRIFVLSRAANRNGQAWWLCRCDCGKQLESPGFSLRRGDTKSCGCLSRERTIARNTKHGASTRAAKQSEYVIWQGMIKRCTNPKANQYADYGGRGIKVCDRWRSSFENFIADMGRKPQGLTLERINNDGNYELGNCKWGTRKEQSRNSRHNHNLTFSGKTQPISAWTEELGFTRGLIGSRLRKGWPVERALTEPARMVIFV